MVLNEKYLPLVEFLPEDVRLDFKNGNVAKKKYIWTKTLMSRLEELLIYGEPWKNKR